MTTRAERWDHRKAQRLRRIWLIAAVVIMHVLGIHLLLSTRQTFHITPEELKNRSITWITLSPPALNNARSLPPNTSGPHARVKTRSHNPAPPAPEPQLVPPTTAPLQDPAQAALQQYMLCGLTDDYKRSPLERERCAEMRRGLVTGPVPPHVPTEQEEATRRRLEHELAVQNAPALAPCILSSMPQVCLINGLLNGFGGVDSYANHDDQPTQGEQFDRHFLKPKGDPRHR
jgi:hypothetical protein